MQENPISLVTEVNNDLATRAKIYKNVENKTVQYSDGLAFFMLFTATWSATIELTIVKTYAGGSRIYPTALIGTAITPTQDGTGVKMPNNAGLILVDLLGTITSIS